MPDPNRPCDRCGDPVVGEGTRFLRQAARTPGGDALPDVFALCPRCAADFATFLATGHIDPDAWYLDPPDPSEPE